MTPTLPEGTAQWKNHAVKVEITEASGYCVHIYRRNADGEHWVHSQIGAASLQELSTLLAAGLDEISRRGFEQGREHVRVALGFSGGPARR